MSTTDVQDPESALNNNQVHSCCGDHERQRVRVPCLLEGVVSGSQGGVEMETVMPDGYDDETSKPLSRASQPAQSLPCNKPEYKARSQKQKVGQRRGPCCGETPDAPHTHRVPGKSVCSSRKMHSNIEIGWQLNFRQRRGSQLSKEKFNSKFFMF